MNHLNSSLPGRTKLFHKIKIVQFPTFCLNCLQYVLSIRFLCLTRMLHPWFDGSFFVRLRLFLTLCYPWHLKQLIQQIFFVIQTCSKCKPFMSTSIVALRSLSYLSFGSFSSKTRTSLKSSYFFMFKSVLIFQPFPPRKLLTDTNSLRTVCILAFPSFVNMLILHLLPFSTSYFCSAAFKSMLSRLSVSE